MRGERRGVPDSSLQMTGPSVCGNGPRHGLAAHLMHESCPMPHAKHEPPMTAYPYAEEDAQGNLRIVALPITVMPREWRAMRVADVLPGMVWSVGA